MADVNTLVEDLMEAANNLRARKNYADALSAYERVLEKDALNVEAHIGKGVCLHMLESVDLARDSFVKAWNLEPEKASALTHYGISLKHEGRLAEAAELYTRALMCDHSYKAGAECLFIVLIDIVNCLKLAGNTQDGLLEYCEAIKADLSTRLKLAGNAQGGMQSYYIPIRPNIGTTLKHAGYTEDAIHNLYEALIAQADYDIMSSWKVVHDSLVDQLVKAADEVKLDAESPSVVSTGFGTRSNVVGNTHDGIESKLAADSSSMLSTGPVTSSDIAGNIQDGIQFEDLPSDFEDWEDRKGGKQRTKPRRPNRTKRSGFMHDEKTSP